MHFFKKYSENVVKYDLINKFKYKTINNVPRIEFITLNFNFKKFDTKMLLSALAALELITSNKGALIKSKSSNISLKIRKGQPIGCKITLRNASMNQFLFNILNKLIIDNNIKKKTSLNLFSIKLQNILMFKELEQNYRFFKNLYNLNLNIKTTDCKFEEFVFLLTSFKFLKYKQK